MRHVWLLTLLVASCHPSKTDESGQATPATVRARVVASPNEARPATKAQPPVTVPTATAEPAARVARLEKGLEIEIAAGSVRAGSPTGSAGRSPSSEADSVEVQVPAFAIDALPYPNDPLAPPLTQVDRAQAQARCKSEGKRLCHELEWERACKGEPARDYPSAAQPFDAAQCAADLARCSSPFGVFALGVLGREWTSSAVTAGLGDALRTAVVRGAATTAEPRAHRCASRDAATPDSKSASLTFRCCRGPEPLALKYPEEPAHAPFAPAPMSKDELQKRLSEVEGWQALASGFRLLSARDVDESLRAAGTTRTRLAPWLAADGALHWSPTRGEQVLVLTGDTPRGAALLAAYPLPDGRLRSIATFVTEHEHTPIVLGYKPDAPSELLFSTCWGCGGEGGALIASEGGVQLVPR